jgi:hypothetical protein
MYEDNQRFDANGLSCLIIVVKNICADFLATLAECDKQNTIYQESDVQRKNQAFHYRCYLGQKLDFIEEYLRNTIPISDTWITFTYSGDEFGVLLDSEKCDSIIFKNFSKGEFVFGYCEEVRND